MPFRIIIFLVAAVFSATAQQKALRFVDADTKRPVVDADVYADSLFIAATDANGNVKVDISGSYKNLIIKHVSYEKRVVSRDSLAVQKVYQLKKFAHVLDEVVLNNLGKQDSLVGPQLNFSWGDKAATYIAYSNDHFISKLRFRVTNFGGVKGMNYLPFMANIYTYDTITRLPGKPLLPQDILVENKDGNKWAEADVSSYRLKVPKEGICITFIIPAKDRGTADDFVWSKVGRIAAVPALEIADGDKKEFSFLYGYVLNGRAYINEWCRVKRKHYMMEIDLEE